MMHRPLRAIWIMVTLILPGLLLAAQSAPADPEAAAIRATIGEYFRGDIERSVERLQAAFHPSAVLQTSDETGKLSVLVQPEWHRKVKQTPDRERPIARILQLDRAGNAAMAKTELVFPHGKFTDYLSLLKLEGKWTIVHKIYQWDAR